MTPEQKKNMRAWVEALRSGEYKQDRGFLRTIYGYCCLGVACDVVAAQVGLVWTRPTELTTVFVPADAKGQFNTSVLPSEIQALFGIDRSGSLRTQRKGEFSLVGLNDNAKYTFDQIADVIEQEWLTEAA